MIEAKVPSPITTWSSSSTPSSLPTSTKSLVRLMSAWLGVASPEGWLCAMIRLGAD